MVLASGGLAGAVYEIGALRAIDDLLVDRTVNDLDIYVGTSAGAVIAAALANGLSPETLLQAIEGSHPEIHPIQHDGKNVRSQQPDLILGEISRGGAWRRGIEG